MSNWIDVLVQPPKMYQQCMFVVISNDHHNNKVYGGSYTGIDCGFHEFSTPGHGFFARYWQPSPEPPQTNEP